MENTIAKHTEVYVHGFLFLGDATRQDHAITRKLIIFGNLQLRRRFYEAVAHAANG